MSYPSLFLVSLNCFYDEMKFTLEIEIHEQFHFLELTVESVSNVMNPSSSIYVNDSDENQTPRLGSSVLSSSNIRLRYNRFIANAITLM